MLELGLIALRLSLSVAVLFWFLPLGMAFAFLGVQLAVFGVYMGASFAPNHKGMPILEADSRLDFLQRQIVTSRNLKGGWWATVLFGGLNHQVEHHLFPNMPRPALSRAREIVREYSAASGISYTSTSTGSGSPRATPSTARSSTSSVARPRRAPGPPAFCWPPTSSPTRCALPVMSSGTFRDSCQKPGPPSREGRLSAGARPPAPRRR